MFAIQIGERTQGVQQKQRECEKVPVAAEPLNWSLRLWRKL